MLHLHQLLAGGVLSGGDSETLVDSCESNTVVMPGERTDPTLF